MLDGQGAADAEACVRRVINSNMAHAARQAVARVGFETVREARVALREFGRRLVESG